MNELIIYTTEGGRSQIKPQADQHTVWLTQQGMAELFDDTKQNISLHLKNIFQEGELDPEAVVKCSLTTASDRSSHRQLFVLYTLCRESPPSTCRPNCQEVLDGSNEKAMAGKWRPDRRVASRRATSVFVASVATKAFASSVTRGRQQRGKS